MLCVLSRNRVMADVGTQTKGCVMTKLQNLLVGPQEASRTVVFSGGACNAIDESGSSIRNERRDSLNTRLDAAGTPFFDPQIHDTTHGRGYNYDLDGPAEKAARAAAQVLLYEIGDDTIAGVSHLEIIRDALSGRPVIVWNSGGSDDRGRPDFRPRGIDTSKPVTRMLLGKTVLAHLAQYEKTGKQLRYEVQAFLMGIDNAHFVRSEDEVVAKLRELGIEI